MGYNTTKVEHGHWPSKWDLKVHNHRGDSAKWPKQTSMKKSSDPASVCSHNPKHKLLQVLGSKYAYIMLHHK